MARLKRESLVQKVSELEAQKKVLEETLSLKEKEYKDEIERVNEGWTQKEATSKQLNESTVSGLKSQMESLEQQIAEKQKQIDKRELKKLAEAYGEQEGINKGEEKTWLIRLAVVAGLLLVSAVVSIWVTHNQSWVESIKYYVVDIILFSAVWFCGTQYSNVLKLKNDYANRKTLAQSFHNILNNLSDNPEIKAKFIEKTTDVLCAPVATGDKEPLLSKKVLKDVAEIIGAAANK